MTLICLQVVNIEHGYEISYNKKGIEVESLQEMDTLVFFICRTRLLGDRILLCHLISIYNRLYTIKVRKTCLLQTHVLRV